MPVPVHIEHGVVPQVVDKYRYFEFEAKYEGKVKSKIENNQY